MGVDGFREELEKRTGFKLEPEKPYTFTSRTDRYGWEQSKNGLWHYTVYIENGRVVDETTALKTGLLAIAETGKCTFRFTSNQNVIISDIQEADKAAIQQLLETYGILTHTENATAIRKNAMACVAMPTCPLALAEAQRYLPSLLTRIEGTLAKHQLQEENIIIRMTGCPNGCGRSYASEIGFVGTGPGRYNLHLGGDHEGYRLNKIYKESLDEENIVNELDNLFGSFKKERKKNESFGDFALRKQLV
jgi:sulfite reductase (NADPH) hemoprotein beta-component